MTMTMFISNPLAVLEQYRSSNECDMWQNLVLLISQLLLQLLLQKFLHYSKIIRPSSIVSPTHTPTQTLIFVLSLVKVHDFSVIKIYQLNICLSILVCSRLCRGLGVSLGFATATTTNCFWFVLCKLEWSRGSVGM